MNSPSRAAFNKSTEGVNLEGELEFALVISGHSLVSFQLVLHFSYPDVIYYTHFNLLFFGNVTYVACFDKLSSSNILKFKQYLFIRMEIYEKNNRQDIKNM